MNENKLPENIYEALSAIVKYIDDADIKYRDLTERQQDILSAYKKEEQHEN